MLVDVEGHYNTLCGFIDQCYLEFTQVSSFKPASAWKLTGRCVGAVFEAQQANRGTVQFLPKSQTIYNKAMVLASLLQGHQVHEDFHAVDFMSHPLLVKEFSLFTLCERVDPEAHKSLEELVESQSTLISKLQMKLNGCKKVQGDQKVLFNDLKSKIVVLEKKK